MFFDGTKVMEAFDYKYCYRIEFPKEITYEQWENEFSNVEENELKILTDKGIDFDGYYENHLHILIETTCEHLGMRYSRWEL